jgi:hypothetical protein
MSAMNRLDQTIQEWRNPDDDPTGYELLRDEINEHLHGKKKFNEMSHIAQLAFGEWEETNRVETKYSPEQARV